MGGARKEQRVAGGGTRQWRAQRATTRAAATRTLAIAVGGGEVLGEWGWWETRREEERGGFFCLATPHFADGALARQQIPPVANQTSFAALGEEPCTYRTSTTSGVVEPNARRGQPHDS